MKIKVLLYSNENFEKFRDSFISNTSHQLEFKILETDNYIEAFKYIEQEITNDCDLIVVADPYCVVTKNLDIVFEKFIESESVLCGTPNLTIAQDLYLNDDDYKTNNILFVNSSFCFINPKLYENIISTDELELEPTNFYDDLSMVLNVVSSSTYCIHNLLLSKEMPITLNFDFYVVCFRSAEENCDIYYFDILGEYNNRHLDDKEQVIVTCKRSIIKTLMEFEKCNLRRL